MEDITILIYYILLYMNNQSTTTKKGNSKMKTKTKIKFANAKTKRKNKINKAIVSIMAIIFLCACMTLSSGGWINVIIGAISGIYVAIYLYVNESYL